MRVCSMPGLKAPAPADHDRSPGGDARGDQPVPAPPAPPMLPHGSADRLQLKYPAARQMARYPGGLAQATMAAIGKKRTARYRQECERTRHIERLEAGWKPEAAALEFAATHLQCCSLACSRLVHPTYR